MSFDGWRRPTSRLPWSCEPSPLPWSLASRGGGMRRRDARSENTHGRCQVRVRIFPSRLRGLVPCISSSHATWSSSVYFWASGLPGGGLDTVSSSRVVVSFPEMLPADPPVSNEDKCLRFRHPDPSMGLSRSASCFSAMLPANKHWLALSSCLKFDCFRPARPPSTSYTVTAWL